MRKELVVRKSNFLIEASYRMTLTESRLVWFAMSKLFNKKPAVLQLTHRVVVKDYAEFFKSHDNSYRDLKNAADSLLRKIITTYKNHDGTPIEGKGYKKYQWFSLCEYQPNKGYIEVTFNRELAPYLTMLNKHFSMLNVERLNNVGSTYTARLWEMLCQYKKEGERIIWLKDLRRFLELRNDQYKEFGDLNRRIIKPALKELDELVDIELAWEHIKKGRKVVGFRFLIEEPEQPDLFK